jgi:glucose/arabinose dehydrogenase
MRSNRNLLSWMCGAAALAAAIAGAANRGAHAQGTTTPEMVDRDLSVRTVVSGLSLPIGIAFLAPNDMLVLEKDTGLVKRVVNGVVTGTVLDLAVNRNSERGLLSIALHPDFPANPGVYLYWTCRSTGAPQDQFFPDEERCLDANMLDDADADDTGMVLEVPLLGNRVDRFIWTGSALLYERNLIMLRAFQNDGAPTPPGQGDEAQPPRGNHNGGVIRFGPDRHLYILIGDNGRRGQLQNLANGPNGGDDDQFGGPEPDDAHLTGVILRLDDRGLTPANNPFFAAGAAIGGEVGSNIQKIYAYGLRNSFGMAFDPMSGALWEQENGDDAFSELNRVEPGFNSGWVQIMGPPERIAQYKAIETTVTPSPPDPFASTYFGLQQLRWSPANIADTPEQARSRLFMLPGAHYSEPEFSWKFEVAPGAIGFVAGRGLGPQFEGDLFVAGARPFLQGGHLFRFNVTGNRRALGVDDRRLEDRVADNRHKWEITESESLLIGRHFGVGTDMHTGPNGNLYVVSLSNGAIYEIFRSAR